VNVRTSHAIAVYGRLTTATQSAIDVRRTHELFSQLLLSYKLNPQTVFYLGYSENRSAVERERIRLAERTFFGKIGYAWLV
jgi:hypothetical protein